MIIKKDKQALILFFAGIFLSALIGSPYTLDVTLSARFIAFSFFTLSSVIFLYRTGSIKTLDTDPVTLPLIAYVLFCGLSFTWSLNKAEALFEIGRLVLGAFAFFLTCFFLRTQKEKWLSLVLRSSILITVVAFLVAYFQAMGLKGTDKESLYIISGINGHKNLYSSFTFLNLFFLILAFVRLKGIWKILAAVAIVLSMVVLGFLRTKAVWIGCGVTVLLFGFIFVYTKIKMAVKVHPAVVALAALVCFNSFILFVLPSVVDKGIAHNLAIATDKTKAELDNERLLLWSKTMSMFQKHKVQGVGAGNWQIYFPDETLKGIWRAEDLNFTFQRPHNDTLWILSETGVIGFNLFFGFIFFLLSYGVRTARKVQDKFIRREIILCLVFICGFIVIAFFDFPKERMEHSVWFAMIMAVLYTHIRENTVIKTVYALHPASFTSIVLIGILTGILGIGILRHQGEYHTRKMYDEKNRTNYNGVIAESKAAESFAYSLDPTSVPLAWYAGNAFAALQNYNASHEQFLIAYKLNPYNRNVLNDLGSSFVIKNDSERAKKLYEEAARISPRFDDAKLNLAAVYIQEKNYVKANEYLHALLHDSERRSNYQKLVDAFLPQQH